MEKTENLKGYIYQSMLADILKGIYVPEMPFTEKELTEKYGVSKSPIREALIELCNEGVLRSIPRYGYEVLRIKEKEVREAKETRLIIECSALAKYFDKLSSDRLDELQLILDAPKTEAEGLMNHWDRNSDFHISLMESYDNSCLTEILTRLMILMKRAYAQYQYNRWQKVGFQGTATFHRELIDTIREGNKDKALKILSDDIASFDTSFLS